MRSRFGIVATATAALVAAIAGTSCNKEEQNTVFKEKTAVSWTPSEESYTIRVGETAKVEGTLLYDDGQAVTLEAFCTSDNPEVVRADGGRKEIAPSLCRWSVEDDGVQHVIYGNDGVVTACQYSGWTIITASYTESGETASASSCITTVD